MKGVWVDFDRKGRPNAIPGKMRAERLTGVMSKSGKRRFGRLPVTMKFDPLTQ